MSKPMIRIHDTNTGEIVDREMTTAEFADYEKEQLKLQIQSNAVAEKETAKADLLAKLGITDDEAKLLLS